MKLTKLSLVAALAVSSAFAGGDIAPVEPVVEAPVVEAAACNSNTTINSKAVLYSFTSDTWSPSGDWYKGDSSALGAAVTVDVAHKITENITANITGVGFTNLTNQYFESQETGAFLNVANITAAYGDTTFVLGRQLLDTPMIKSFDWLLAPGAFEAYTLVNTSIENVTVVGSYIEAYRMNGSDVDFDDLDGDNWTIGASYSDAFDASVWYYNVDGLTTYGGEEYTQVYADAGVELSGIKLAAQYVDTDWDMMDDSTAYGIKAETAVAGFDLAAAYVNVDDAKAGFVDWDGLYTSMWMTAGSNSVGDSWMVSAATEFSGLSVSAAYGYFEYDDVFHADEGSEFDLILGYGVTDCISLDAIYTSTDYGFGTGDDQVMELIATYKF